MEMKIIMIQPKQLDNRTLRTGGQNQKIGKSENQKIDDVSMTSDLRGSLDRPFLLLARPFNVWMNHPHVSCQRIIP